MQNITETMPNGDVFEAILRDGTKDDWTINYPTGGTRFFGTAREVKKKIKELAKEVAE